MVVKTDNYYNYSENNNIGIVPFNSLSLDHLIYTENKESIRETKADPYSGRKFSLFKDSDSHIRELMIQFKKKKLMFAYFPGVFYTVLSYVDFTVRFALGLEPVSLDQNKIMQPRGTRECLAKESVQ